MSGRRSKRTRDVLFNLTYEDTVPLLSKAAAAGDLVAVEKLLRKGCLPQTPDNRGWCAVHSCVQANQIKALKLILNFKARKKKYLTNLCTWEGESPLIIAAKNETVSLDILKTLLQSGANPKLATNDGMTALHYICRRKGRCTAAKLLIKHGALIDVKEFVGGYTPLHFAIVEAADIKLVKYLVDSGDVNLPDFDLETPLNKACVCNFSETVEYILLKDTSSVNVVPKSCLSSLSAAALNGNLKMVKLLLDAGANTDVRGPAGFHRRELCRNNFLPIHSSILADGDIFKLLLQKMNPITLLEYERATLSNSLAIYTMMYAASPCYFEILIQHTFPPGFDDLKRVDLTKLVNFILQTQDYTQSSVVKRFQLLFKYCSYFEPETVFEHFVSLISNSRHELLRKYDIFYVLANMGVSSCRAYQSKCKLIPFLYEMSEWHHKKERFLEIIKTLNQPVLTLKQISRVVSRRFIRSAIGNDLLVHEFIRDSSLPTTLKDFLWYQSLS